MAIDLPPVMPPQLASQQQISEMNQSGAAVIQATVGGIEMRVLGNVQLSSDQVEAVLNNAKTPSAAITDLTRRYYNAGHLLVTVRYFRSGNTVTVLVSQSAVKGLRGDPDVTRHFEGLIGDSDLSLAEFDRARVLADFQAQRQGVEYRISYEQHFDDQVILNFQQRPGPDRDATDIVAEASNRGSRFLGRYFASLGLKQDFSTGTQLRLSAQTAFPELGEDGDGDDYRQLDLALDHPFAFGLYGFEASQIRYQRSPSLTSLSGPCLLGLIGCNTTVITADLDAEIDRFALTGEQVLYSNPVQRLNLFQRLEHIDSEIRLKGEGQALLDESYQTIGLGLRYSSRGPQLDEPSYFKAELGVTAGWGDDDGSFDRETGDGVSIGKRSSDFLVINPRLAYKFVFTESLQLAASVHGQFFSGDRQLPQQQQFVLGGMDSLGAYLPGVLIGDNGYYANLVFSSQQQWWGLRWEPALFVEYGSSDFNDAGNALGDAQTIADAGLRLKLGLPMGFETEVLAATPLFDDVDNDARREALEADFFWRLRWTY